MPRKKSSSKTEPQTPDTPPPKPTYDDVAEAALWLMQHTGRVPTLWGPTSWGKTRMASALAERLGAKLIKVLASTENVDEINGFLIETGGEVVQLLPPWFRAAKEHLEAGPENRVLLFFDEIGQARADSVAVLYTFLRDREVRWQTLPADRAYVMAACNHAEFQGGFRERVAFLHVPADAGRLLEIAGDHEIARYLAERVGGRYQTEASAEYCNLPPPEPPVYDPAAVDAVRQIGSDFWRLAAPAQRLVFDSLLPGDLADMAFRAFVFGGVDDLTPFVQEPELLADLLAHQSVPEAVATAISALSLLLSLDSMEHRVQVVATILDALVREPAKLFAYYEAPMSSTLDRNLAALSNNALVAHLKERGLIWADNGRLHGAWIDLAEKESGS